MNRREVAHAVAAGAVFIGLSAPPRAEEAEPIDGWAKYHLALEASLGIGTPVGLLGIEGRIQLLTALTLPTFEFAAGKAF